MKEITSIHNPIIKEYQKLHQKKERDKQQLFLVEGYHLVEEAKKANKLKTVFIEQSSDAIDGVENILVTNEIIQKLSNVHSPQPIVGVVHYLQFKNPLGNRVLVLERLQDPGNIGTLLRSGLGFGFLDVVLSEDSVDIYHDKLIRSSQGAIFSLQLHVDNTVDIATKLKNKGFYLLGTAISADATTMEKIISKQKMAIFLGNEATGMSNELKEKMDALIRIETSNSLESLNVAVAGGILMHQFRNISFV